MTIISSLATIYFSLMNQISFDHVDNVILNLYSPLRPSSSQTDIRSEIQDIQDGRIAAKDSTLKNAPHTAASVMAADWDRAYTREQAVYPLVSNILNLVLPEKTKNFLKLVGRYVTAILI